jgi:hypothetical protein
MRVSACVRVQRRSASAPGPRPTTVTLPAAAQRVAAARRAAKRTRRGAGGSAMHAASARDAIRRRKARGECGTRAIRAAGRSDGLAGTALRRRGGVQVIVSALPQFTTASHPRPRSRRVGSGDVAAMDANHVRARVRLARCRARNAKRTRTRSRSRTQAHSFWGHSAALDLQRLATPAAPRDGDDAAAAERCDADAADGGAHAPPDEFNVLQARRSCCLSARVCAYRPADVASACAAGRAGRLPPHGDAALPRGAPQRRHAPHHPRLRGAATRANALGPPSPLRLSARRARVETP